MTTFATCGHEINPDWTLVLYVALRTIADDHDLDRLEHAVSYQVLCPSCLRLAEAAGEVLYGEDEEHKWLESEN